MRTDAGTPGYVLLSNHWLNRKRCSVPEMGLVTIFCPLTTIGAGDTALQAAGNRFVADCKVNPAALVGHVKITLTPERIILSSEGSGNERLNTVPIPKLPPLHAVP